MEWEDYEFTPSENEKNNYLISWIKQLSLLTLSKFLCEFYFLWDLKINFFLQKQIFPDFDSFCVKINLQENSLYQKFSGDEFRIPSNI